MTSDLISFNNAQLGVIQGKDVFSLSFWYMPTSPSSATNPSQDSYRLFRVSGDPSDESDIQSTPNGVLLGVSYSTSTLDVYRLVLTYGKDSGTFATESFDFPYLEDNWIFFYVGLDYV